MKRATTFPKCATTAAILVLVVAQLACGAPERKPLNLYPTPTRATTQTPIVQTVVAQVTVVVAHPVTVVAHPTEPSTRLCVTAQETVHLRPSPNTDGYPITVLQNGQEVVDLGGRDGAWLYVQAGDKAGWIYKAYLGDC